MQCLNFIAMSETRRWLVRTREMERREIEDKKGVKRIEENYKHLVNILLFKIVNVNVL